ncbi:MAG TPA: sigma-70 family RNA polymerase sigma factor [Caldisericia bacterium]|nr:sigma-70 family RNA polymerase sigma factor [Caldisericia bacterium]HPF49575.1 sigma-70 family RNA polymerase sigma factor [Caldisericia bacterium]HPI84509.1 sigma-70 family RNA polymerase sigma factor [Caldisericia bacterium]HPQ93875.1 sigma-70 family RNA polymerase sigma factor [Caldisericia bacterium]HRV75420.1 sigma-70 family RNA polymerase sigma factor [Caldisericia bacterium]
MEPQDVVKIAKKIEKGDNEPFAEIVEEYQGFVYNFSLRLTGNRENAWDLASEVFMRVLSQLSKYSPEFPFKSWIGRVTYTTGLNYLRKHKRTIQIESLAGDVPFEVPDDGEIPDDVVIDNSIRKSVSDAIQKLKPDFRAIITLCDIEELSYEDAAQALSIPLGTVRSRLFRARSALKKILNGTKQRD